MPETDEVNIQVYLRNVSAQTVVLAVPLRWKKLARVSIHVYVHVS